MNSTQQKPLPSFRPYALEMVVTGTLRSGSKEFSLNDASTRTSIACSRDLDFVPIQAYRKADQASVPHELFSAYAIGEYGGIKSIEVAYSGKLHTETLRPSLSTEGTRCRYSNALAEIASLTGALGSKPSISEMQAIFLVGRDALSNEPMRLFDALIGRSPIKVIFSVQEAGQEVDTLALEIHPSTSIAPCS